MDRIDERKDRRKRPVSRGFPLPELALAAGMLIALLGLMASVGVWGLLLLLGGLLVLAGAAGCLGVDSRDGRDWNRRDWEG